MKLTVSLAALALSTWTSAQDPCEGNGLGQAYISTTSAIINGTLELDLGSTAPTTGIVVLSTSSDYGPSASPFPFLPGTICLDPFAPGYKIRVFPLGPGGNTHLSVPISGTPADAYVVPPIFADSLTIEGGILSLSKTVRTSFENADSHKQVGDMGAVRAFHTATALGTGPRDNRTKVLVAGGGIGSIISPQATTSTELYDLLSRTYTPGPNMTIERTFHAAVRLQDGRVLIAGGVDSSGIVTSTCDLYDPVTNTITPTGSMTAQRTSHAMTLLNDGRVLVTGGLADYQNAGINLIGVLNTSQNTGEIYDPGPGTWTPLGQTMNSKRSGHSQVLLDDGRVLIIAGIIGGSTGIWGGAFPIFTSLCEMFDPTTDTLSATAGLSFTGFAFNGVSKLADGDVLVTGGMYETLTTGAIVSQGTARFDTATETWSNQGSLPVPTWGHGQAALPDGRALIVGGFTSVDVLLGSSTVGIHDGTSFGAVAPLGTNVGNPTLFAKHRGAQRLTPLSDGTFLVSGGMHTSSSETTFPDSFVYQP